MLPLTHQKLLDAAPKARVLNVVFALGDIIILI